MSCIELSSLANFAVNSSVYAENNLSGKEITYNVNDIKNNRIIPDIPEGWQAIDINFINPERFQIINFIDENNNQFSAYSNKTGFGASVYAQEKNGEVDVVISYASAQGADPSDKGNMIEILLQQIPKQYDDALNFYENVKQSVASEYYGKKVNISITGWSLGGGLAQLVGAKTGAKTTTFAAPGMQYALDDLKLDTNIGKYNYIDNYSVMNDSVGNYGKKVGNFYLYPPTPANYKDPITKKY